MWRRRDAILLEARGLRLLDLNRRSLLLLLRWLLEACRLRLLEASWLRLLKAGILRLLLKLLWLLSREASRLGL